MTDGVSFNSDMFCYSYFEEHQTGSGTALPPVTPRFEWNAVDTENGMSKVRVRWLPDNQAGNPGSHFYLKYR